MFLLRHWTRELKLIGQKQKKGTKARRGIRAKPARFVLFAAFFVSDFGVRAECGCQGQIHKGSLVLRIRKITKPNPASL
jgi:hypothetical protein